MYDSKKRRFVADASELTKPLFDRVYADACDEGFTLISHKTGQEVKCAVYETMMKDGDIVGWRLKPIHRNGPQFDILIFND